MAVLTGCAQGLRKAREREMGRCHQNGTKSEAKAVASLQRPVCVSCRRALESHPGPFPLGR